MKLEYLNKHHLMRTMSVDDGLTNLAEHVHDTIKAAFPLRCASPENHNLVHLTAQHSRFTTVPYIKGVITSLQVRIPAPEGVPKLNQHITGANN